MTGTIKKMIKDRGFGFITPEGSDKDLFFHSKDVTGDTPYDSLEEHDKVSFEVVEGPKGPAAANVQKVA